MAPALLATAPAEVQADWLPRMASGEALVVPALQERAARYRLNQVATRATLQGGAWQLDGTKCVVPAGDEADAWIVPARTAGSESDSEGIALFLVPVSYTHLGFAAQVNQRTGHGGQSEGVVLTQAGALLDFKACGGVGHERILLDPAPDLARDTATLQMPSFDTVIEPDLVELRNAVEQSTKEIGTRFDFKGSSAAVELADRSTKDRELSLFGDSDFQLQQVRDVLLTRLAKRGVDVRFLDFSGTPQKMGGDKLKLSVPVKSGVDAETAKKLSLIHI